MKTILFVDDEDYVAVNFIKEIEKRFTVTYVRNPDDAIAELAKNRFDGMVLDIRMPMPKDGNARVLDQGNYSGLWVLEKCQEKLLTDGTRVSILTNVNTKRVLEKVEFFEIELAKDQLRLTSKGQTNADRFALELAAFVRSLGGESGGLASEAD